MKTLAKYIEGMTVLVEHTGMKTELYQRKIKIQGVIYRASFQHNLHSQSSTSCTVNAYNYYI